MVNFLLELKEKNIMIGIFWHQKSRHSWRSMLAFLAIDGQHHSKLFIPFRNGLKESAFLITDNVTHTKYNSKLKNSKPQIEKKTNVHGTGFITTYTRDQIQSRTIFQSFLVEAF